MTRWESCVRWPPGCPEPRVSHVPPADGSQADAAAGLAGRLGVELDGWQRGVLGSCLGRSGGRWAAFEVGLIVPRQNGKSLLCAVRELAGLLLFGERLVIHSAHEWRTVSQQFRLTVDLIEASPLRSLVSQVRRTGGEEAIEFTGGARLRFMNRSKESARGFSADCVVLDEAHALTEEQAGALLPTLSSRPDPQVWYAAAGPAPGAWQLSRLRSRVAGDDPGRLAWNEWSAHPAGDLEDERVWAACNPGVAAGRLSIERMREERAGLGPSGFAAERLAAAPWPSELEGIWQVIPEDAWAACSSPVASMEPFPPQVPAAAAPAGPQAATVPAWALQSDGVPPWVRRSAG
jgi:hypothetical protein